VLNELEPSSEWALRALQGPLDHGPLFKRISKKRADFEQIRKMELRRSGRLASAGRSEKVRRLAGIPEAVAFVPAIYLVALCEPCRSAGIARNS
jgi:hypothetical protein